MMAAGLSDSKSAYIAAENNPDKARRLKLWPKGVAPVEPYHCEVQKGSLNMKEMPSTRALDSVERQ